MPGMAGAHIKMKDLPHQIELMEQIAEELENWFNDDSRVLLTLSDSAACASFKCSISDQIGPVIDWFEYHKPHVAKIIEEWYDYVREIRVFQHNISPFVISLPARVLAAKLRSIARYAREDLSLQGKVHPNIKEIVWPKAKKYGEKYVKNKGFPGITKLAKELGYPRNTMRKAIKRSKILTKAEKQYKKRTGTPIAVTLTNKVLASNKTNDEIDPSMAADKDALLKKLIEQVPPEKKAKTEAEIKNMSEEQKRKFAKLYAEQLDDIQQDDPTTRKPRRRKV